MIQQAGEGFAAGITYCIDERDGDVGPPTYRCLPVPAVVNEACLSIHSLVEQVAHTAICTSLRAFFLSPRHTVTAVI